MFSYRLAHLWWRIQYLLWQGVYFRWYCGYLRRRIEWKLYVWHTLATC